MTDVSASFNPYGIKLAHLLRAQQAFGVKVLPLMEKMEKMDGIEIDKLELEEVLTFMFLALDMNGKNPRKDDLLEMNLDELGALFSDIGVVAPDPT